jgi:hypothetical protein
MHSFDEDTYFGDESDCAPLTEAQRAALAEYSVELAALAAVQAEAPTDW